MPGAYAEGADDETEDEAGALGHGNASILAFEA
jgi:hypothetical protein